MKNIKNIVLMLILALLLTGCGQSEATPNGMQGENGEPPIGQEQRPEGAWPEGNMPPGNWNGGQAAETISIEELERLDTTDLFSNRDKESSYDAAEAVAVTLTGDTASCTAKTVKITDSTVTITDEGTYILSGSLNSGSVVVEAEDSDKVQLVLDDVDITCATSAAIYVKQADKVFVTLADNSENHLAVTGEFVADEENNVDAVLFSKADLTLNGAGALKVETTHGHGIVTKDDLVIVDGDYQIEVSGKALNGKDSVRIANGNFVINAGDDGIYSEHDEDYEKGFVYIEDGNYAITAGGDGIHAGAQNVIAGGKIDILKCEEGIEGASVDVRSGTITLTSTDDGINASIPDQFEAQSDKISCYICISGGAVDVTAYGDGIDANGNLYIFGGATYVSGPESNDNGSIDYDGVGQISGGIVVAAGFGGMSQNFGNSSTQGAMTVNLSETQKAGTLVKLEDSAGNLLISFEPKADYNCVTISCPDLKEGETYTLTAGAESKKIEMTSLINGGNGMGGGMPGGRPGGMGGMRGDGQMPEMPENWNGEVPEGMPEMPQGGMPGGERPQGGMPQNR